MRSSVPARLYTMHMEKMNIAPDSSHRRCQTENSPNPAPDEFSVVKAKYSDGNSEEITDYTITDGTKLKLDQKSVTISYNGKTVTQAIEVKENSVKSIAIKTAPTKTEYLAGEDFDKTGMVIEATYDDETKKEVTDYTIKDGKNLKNGQTSVTIEFGGKQ